MRTVPTAIAAAIAALLLPISALAGETTVEVGHGSFEPAELIISVGDTVKFANTKEMPGGHTVVFDELDAQSEGLAKGKSWSHTFEKPGTYSFHVKEHPKNTGTITVE